MPKKKKDSIMNPAQEKQLVIFLKKQGLKDKEILSATREIRKRLALGLTPPPEVIQEYLIDRKEKETAKQLKALQKLKAKKPSKEPKAKIANGGSDSVAEMAQKEQQLRELGVVDKIPTSVVPPYLKSLSPLLRTLYSHTDYVCC